MANDDLRYTIVIDDSGAKSTLQETDRGFERVETAAKKTGAAISDYEKQVRATVASHQAANTAVNTHQASLSSLVQQLGLTQHALYDNTAAAAKLNEIFLVAGASGAAIAVVFAVAAVKLYALAESAAHAGAALQDAHEKTGRAVESLSRLSNAAPLAKTSLSSLTDVIGAMQKMMAENSAQFEHGLTSLGLRAAEFKTLAPERQLEAIAAGLKDIDDPVRKAVVGTELLGDKFRAAAPALDKLNEALALTKDLNPWTEQETAQAEQFEMHVASIRAHMDAIGDSLGRVALPAVERLVAKLDELVHWAPNHWMQMLLSFGGGPIGMINAAASGGTTLGYLDSAASMAGIRGLNLPTSPKNPYAREAGATEQEIQQIFAGKLGPVDTRVVGATHEETDRLMVAFFAEQKRAREKYVREWQETTDAVQKIWGEAFAAQARLDKDSLTSQLAVLEQRRVNEENAAAIKISETTKSEELLQQMVFAIQAKYAALEHNAIVDAVQKVEKGKVDAIFDFGTEQRKATQKQFEIEAKSIDETQKLWIDYYDFVAKQSGNSAAYQIAQVERWLDEKVHAAHSAGIIDQQYYDALQARAKQQIDALIAGLGTLNGPISGMLLFHPANESAIKQNATDLKLAALNAREWGNALDAVSKTMGTIAGLTGGPFSAIATGISQTVGATKELVKTMQLVSQDRASGGAGFNVANLASLAAGWVGVAVAVFQVVMNLKQMHDEAEKAHAEAAAANQALIAFHVSTPFSDSLAKSLADTKENFKHITALNTKYGDTLIQVHETLHRLDGSIIEVTHSTQLLMSDLAEAANLTAIIKELGGISALTADQLASVERSAHNLFILIALGGPIGQQAIKTMDDTLIAFTQNLEASGGVVSQFFLDMVEEAHRLGIVLPQVQQFLRDQASTLASGLTDLLAQPMIVSAAQVGKAVRDAQKAVDDLVATGKASASDLTKAQDALTDALTTQHAEAERNQDAMRNLGYEAVLAFNAAIASGSNFMQALQGISGQLGTLQQAYKDLGLEIDDAAIKGLLLENTILNGTADRPSGLGKAISGLQAIFTAAQNIPGLMTPDVFKANQGILGSLYTQTQAAAAAGGGSTINALIPFQQTLHAMQDYATKNHLDLDRNTQQMIDQSKELGIWTDDFKSDSEKTRESIADLIKSNYDLIVALAGSGRADGQPPPTSGTTPPTRPGGWGETDPTAPPLTPYPIPMASGGVGFASGPMSFSTRGNEEFAFSGEGRRFSRGGSAPPPTEVNFYVHASFDIKAYDGKDVQRSVEEDIGPRFIQLVDDRYKDFNERLFAAAPRSRS